MLAYSKMILEKVSFDALLFRKEMRKLKRWMHARDGKERDRRCKEKYHSFLFHYNLISKY